MDEVTQNGAAETVIQLLITPRNKSQSACENDSVAHLLGNNGHLRGIVNNDVGGRGKQIFVRKQTAPQLRSHYGSLVKRWRNGFGFKSAKAAAEGFVSIGIKNKAKRSFIVPLTMQSTIPGSYSSKQADINQPHHVTPRVTSSHPAITCLIGAEAIWEARCFKQLQPAERFSRQG